MCLLNLSLLGNRTSLDVGTVSFTLRAENGEEKQTKKKEMQSGVMTDQSKTLQLPAKPGLRLMW